MISLDFRALRARTLYMCCCCVGEEKNEEVECGTCLGGDKFGRKEEEKVPFYGRMSAA